MGYFSFAFIFTIILGIMCFLLTGCSNISQKTSLSNIPPVPVYQDTVCEIDTQRKILLKEADILNQKTSHIIKEQDAEAENYEPLQKK